MAGACKYNYYRKKGKNLIALVMSYTESRHSRTKPLLRCGACTLSNSSYYLLRTHILFTFAYCNGCFSLVITAKIVCRL